MESLLSPVYEGEFLTQHIPHAKLEVIPKRCQVTIWEIPEIMVQALDEWVEIKSG